MIGPKVSIIIPVYNAEKYLKQCLDSLINQTLKEIEIVCVDDVSPDNSMKIITEYSKNDDRVKYISMDKNSGSGLARNKGIENAHGEYLSFIDSDDHVMDNTVYEKVYNHAVKNHANMVSANLLSYENGKYINNRDCLRINEENAIIPQDYGIPWHHQKNIYKRSFILEHDIEYPDYKRGQDPVFLAKVLKNVDLVYCLPLDLYAYRKYEKYDNINSETKELDYIKHFRDVFDILDLDSFKETHLKYQDRMYNFLTNPGLYFSSQTVEINIKKVFGDDNDVLTIYELKKTLKEKKNIINQIKFSSRYNKYIKTPETDYLFDSIIQGDDTLNLEIDGRKLNLDMNSIVEEFYETQHRENIGRSISQRLLSNFSMLYIIFNRNNSGIKGVINNIKGYRSIKRNEIFDIGYYLKMYPDIRNSGKDPLLHYMFHGFKEERNPNASFDNEYYLNENPDVKDLNLSPLVHYVLYGQKEKRNVAEYPETKVVNVKLINYVSGRNNAIEIKYNRPIKPGTEWIELKNNETKEPVSFKRKFFKNRIYLVLSRPLHESEEYRLILHSKCVTDIFNQPLGLYSNNFFPWNKFSPE